MVRMKALTSFYGDEGKVKVGEFYAKEGNVSEYEASGLAVRVVEAQARGADRQKNEAAETGPFVSVGGEIGEEKPSQLSRRGRPRKLPISNE